MGGIREFVTTYAAAGHNIELVDMARETLIGEKGCNPDYCCPAGIPPAKATHFWLRSGTTTSLARRPMPLWFKATMRTTFSLRRAVHEGFFGNHSQVGSDFIFLRFSVVTLGAP